MQEELQKASLHNWSQRKTTIPAIIALSRAREIAMCAHEGQVRRTGDPYWYHLSEVALRVSGDELAVDVAWLHDVLEDTQESPSSLRTKGVSQNVIRIVQLLTKGPTTCYAAYLREISKHEIARKVKIADMLHNLSDSPTEQQIVKYRNGLRILLETAPDLSEAEGTLYSKLPKKLIVPPDKWT